MADSVLVVVSGVPVVLVSELLVCPVVLDMVLLSVALSEVVLVIVLVMIGELGFVVAAVEALVLGVLSDV